MAIFGLAFSIKEIDGPWNILTKSRNWLITNKYFGVFFYNLLSCYVCVGFHAGWIVWLLSQFAFGQIICWGLAGSTICILLNSIISLLTAINNKIGE